MELLEAFLTKLGKDMVSVLVPIFQIIITGRVLKAQQDLHFLFLNRRESEFGFIGPYAGIINQSATMAGQVHLGGIGTTGCAIPPSYLYSYMST